MDPKVRALRAVVTERLTAAAEEIFALVERTIAEYEEELCRSKEENQRKQQLLDSVLVQQNPAPQTGVHIGAVSPEEAAQSFKQKHVESAAIKEEPEDFCFVRPASVKSEWSPLQPPEHREETPGERRGGANAEYSLDLFTQNKTTDANRVWSRLWEPPAGSSTETEADGDHYNQVQRKDTHDSGLFSKYKCGAESRAAVTEGHGEQQETEGNHYNLGPFGFKSPSENMTLYLGNAKVHECSFCEKRFTTNQSLQIHIRVHTGEKPYSCPFCKKCFTQKAHLKTHIRTHTKEKPYRCSVCLKSFMHKVSLNLHLEKTHPDFVG